MWLDELLHRPYVGVPLGYMFLKGYEYFAGRVVAALSSAAGAQEASGSHSLLSQLASYILFGGAWAGTTVVALSVVKTVLFTTFFLLPAIIVAKVIPAEETKAKHLAESSNSRHVKITAEWGVELDAIELIHQASDHWVVFSNANGVPLEQNLDFLKKYSEDVGVNVLTYNYRGVGKSSGWPYTSKDLARDCSAAIRYLLEKRGAKEEYIVLHGHSLGGGVSSQLLAQHPRLKLINDRSFRSLSAAAGVIMGHLNPFMSYALSLLLASTFHLTARFSPFAASVSFTTCLVAAVPVGYFLQHSGVVVSLGPMLLQWLGWEIDGASDFDPKRCMCFYHLNDNVLPIGHSDAFTALREAHGSDLQCYRILVDHGNPHMVPLDHDASEWRAIVKVLREFIFAYRLSHST